MLEITDLAAGYGMLEVLHGIDLTVVGDRAMGVLGANGAGKSTLCRAISGLIPMRRGRMRFDGADITAASPAARVRRGVVQVPEGRQVFPRMTVGENLRLGAWIPGRPDPSALRPVFDLFPILRDRLDQHAGLLSGGEQQMLALGRAMMARPRLLILDEPSQGLAPKAVLLVADAVRTIRAGGVAVLIVEQNLALAGAIADDACVLEGGLVAARGVARDVLAGDALAARYLGHV